MRPICGRYKWLLPLEISHSILKKIIFKNKTLKHSKWNGTLEHLDASVCVDFQFLLYHLKPPGVLFLRIIVLHREEQKIISSVHINSMKRCLTFDKVLKYLGSMLFNWSTNQTACLFLLAFTSSFHLRSVEMFMIIYVYHVLPASLYLHSFAIAQFSL